MEVNKLAEAGVDPAAVSSEEGGVDAQAMLAKLMNGPSEEEKRKAAEEKAEEEAKKKDLRRELKEVRSQTNTSASSAVTRCPAASTG